MKFCLKAVLLLSCFAAATCRGGESEVGARCEFHSEAEVMKDAKIVGSVLVPRPTLFLFVDEPSASDGRVLAVEANSSSAFLIFRLAGLDLRKYPYMRWRWRVVRQLNLPVSDAEDPDDQVCVIYIADGSKLNQKCVGYRWEHNTKVGTCRMINYGGGVRRVQALCVRNCETPVGEWVEEERNVLEDFRKAFGKAPSSRFAITIGGNTQYTNSDTRVEIDYIEFRSAPKSAE